MMGDDSICLFPEYSWGSASQHEVIEIIDEISDHLTYRQQVILGSHPFKKGEKTHNSAIYINGNKKRIFVPKTNVLQEEKQRQNVISGDNPGIINYNGLKILILICSDLWNGILLNNLIGKVQIDVLCVPAFTVVAKGLGNYAKLQWYSLIVSRSREFLIPIIVADHHISTDYYDVGGASAIADPSKKDPSMKDFVDFLDIPDQNIIGSDIDLDRVNEYRKYRKEKGIHTY